MRIIDWSSDVCSSDLHGNIRMTETPKSPKSKKSKKLQAFMCMSCNDPETSEIVFATSNVAARRIHTNSQGTDFADAQITRKKEFDQYAPGPVPPKALLYRSEEHTTELQSLMRTSY